MDSSQFFGITTFLYLFATVLYIAIFVFRANKLGLGATALTIIGLLVQTAAIGLRWMESYRIGYGHAPLSNMYESLVFFSWTTALIYLFVEFIYKNKTIGTFAMPFAFLGMGFASFMDPKIAPLVPALQSNWLIAHVITCFIGYAAFAVACGLGIMYLLKDQGESSAPKGMNKKGEPAGLLDTLPELRVLDDIIHKSLVFGFLWLSTGIITGAIWANSAWGTYWSWDPKETWSLITWFVYAVALHARFTRGWGGTRIAWIAIVGFVAVVFTYYGVNFWLSGLHSYGR